MRRDLLDALRCPASHDESWLVAVVHAAVGPSIIDADLACPICHAAYPLRAGVAHFGPPRTAAAVRDGSHAVTLDPIRVAALLGLTEGATPLLLAGAYANVGETLHALCPSPQLWINRTAVPTIDEHSLLCVSTRVPLGAATLAAAAVDGAHADEVMLTSIIRAVRQGGRILAPVAVQVPPALRASVRELARDATEWVAEVTIPPSGLVTLRRQPSA